MIDKNLLYSFIRKYNYVRLHKITLLAVAIINYNHAIYKLSLKDVHQ